MPCKHDKDALIEAAASGAPPQGELRLHLAGCADCRSAFEQERSLFASIDGGLRFTANADVPASLLPRVRARVDEESVPRRTWVSNWFVLASAAVMVVAFFAARAVWRTKGIQRPAVTAVTAPGPPGVISPPQNHDFAGKPQLKKNDGLKYQVVVTKKHSASEMPGRGKTAPEVLVTCDQEILLADYAEQWSLHKHPLLVAQGFAATSLLPLQLAPIQIDELGVKLLADEKLP